MSERVTSGFSRRLKQLREQAGLSQQDLADRADMHRFGIAKIEQGLREPSWATVQALAKALGTNCLAFVDEGDAEAPAADTPASKPGRPRKAPQADTEEPAAAPTADKPARKPTADKDAPTGMARAGKGRTKGIRKRKGSNP